MEGKEKDMEVPSASDSDRSERLDKGFFSSVSNTDQMNYACVDSSLTLQMALYC